LTVFAGVLAMLIAVAGIYAIPGMPQLRAAAVCGANPDPPSAMRPAIVVSAPLPNAQSTSPLAVSGQARVFEAVVSLALKDAGGATIVAGTTQTQAGAPALAPFAAALSFNVTGVTPACLWVFEASARDGSPVNVVNPEARGRRDR